MPRYLQQQGYVIIPVNPTAAELLGVPAYPSLRDIPQHVAQAVDVVQVFRPAGQILPIVQDAEYLKVAATAAQAAGLRVVMDRCMMVEHRRMMI